MPTGNCKYPEHQRPSAGPPVGLVVAILIGALAVLHWHTMLVILIVAAVLLLLGGAVMLLLHNHSSGYDEHFEHQAELELRLRLAVQRRKMHPATQPAVHNHVHLHGVDAASVAAAINPGSPCPDRMAGTVAGPLPSRNSTPRGESVITIIIAAILVHAAFHPGAGHISTAIVMQGLGPRSNRCSIRTAR